MLRNYYIRNVLLHLWIKRDILHLVNNRWIIGKILRYTGEKQIRWNKGEMSIIDMWMVQAIEAHIQAVLTDVIVIRKNSTAGMCKWAAEVTGICVRESRIARIDVQAARVVGIRTRVQAARTVRIRTPVRTARAVGIRTLVRAAGTAGILVQAMLTVIGIYLTEVWVSGRWMSSPTVCLTGRKDAGEKRQEESGEEEESWVCCWCVF